MARRVAMNGETTSKMLGGASGKGFMPGKSGNPSGRPKLTDAEREAREMLKAASPQAVRALTAALSSDDEDMRVKAAQAILGKVFPQGIDLTVSGPGGGPVEVKRIDTRGLSREQLEALLAALKSNASE